MTSRGCVFIVLAAACSEAQSSAPEPVPSSPPSAVVTQSAETTAAVAGPIPESHQPRAPRSCPRKCYDIERCDEDKGECVPACPKGMVYVPPSGPEGFVMGKDFLGSAAGDSKNYGKGHISNTDAPHRVVLTQPFCLDAYEVTVRKWKACMKDHGCRKPDIAHRFVMWPDHEDHPVNCVSWRDAKHYCAVENKTLPSEAQWEWAATGGDGRAYPWGNEPASCERADYTQGVLSDHGGAHPAADAGCGGGGPSPVGSHPKGDRVWPDGVIHDLAGNVWEWCLDNYRPYARERRTDPVVWLSRDLPHALRGGGWNRSHQGIKAAFRGAGVVDYRVPGLGFRCAKNPAAEGEQPAWEKGGSGLEP